jgi:hypothetical protein
MIAVAVVIVIVIALSYAMVETPLAGYGKRSRILIFDAASSVLLWRRWKMPMLKRSMSWMKYDARRRRLKKLWTVAMLFLDD